MLDQRRRRWANVVQMVYKCFVFAGIIHHVFYVCFFCICRREADNKLYVKYEVIGQNHVAVPTHFFKVVVAETDKGERDLLAYVMPNAPIGEHPNLSKYLVPPETIERAGGILLFEHVGRKTLRTINGNKV